MNKRLTAALLTVFLTMLFACGSAFAAVPDAPEPFYAADFANVLEQETEDYITEQNGVLENACGAQIVVVTTDFLDGMDIEDYAYTIFNNWKIGDADKNNGVLLLLAIGEENYWCMQGKGLESALTSGMIDDILWNDLEEDFAAGDYDSGARKTFDALYAVVYDYYDVGAAEGAAGNTVSDEDADWTMGTIIGLLIMVLVIVAVIVLIAKLVRGIGRSFSSGSSRGVGGGRIYPSSTRPRRRSTPPPPPMPPRDWSGPGSASSRRPSAPVRRSSSGSRPTVSRSSTSSRPASRPSSSSRPASRPSGSGRGGGGASRGGGAGRRGR